MFKVFFATIVLPLAALSASGAVYYPLEYSSRGIDAGEAPPASPAGTAKYQFKYGVHDSGSGQAFKHSEERQGAKTSGSYEVALPDGRIQVVNYTADENGFIADVSYEGDPKFSTLAYSKPRHFHPSPWYSLPESTTVRLAPLFRATSATDVLPAVESELVETTGLIQDAVARKEAEESADPTTDNHVSIVKIPATESSATAATDATLDGNSATYIELQQREEVSSSKAVEEVVDEKEVLAIDASLATPATFATPAKNLLQDRELGKPSRLKYPYAYKYSLPYYRVPYLPSRYNFYRPPFYSFYPWYTPYYRHQYRNPVYPFQYQRGTVPHQYPAHYRPQYY